MVRGIRVRSKSYKLKPKRLLQTDFMDKTLLEQLKQKLLEEKVLLEKDLSSFAKKDPNMKGDWDTVFPQMGEAQSGSHSSLDESADEVEEYENLTAKEFTLETRLAEVNRALERINKDGFGLCQKCGKEISKERLYANPAAEFDIECS
ncbi:MAG: Transcriptional regulator, TraR/DksA family [Parcubacteria group bacterium GW2011_GWA2_42_14]|nr:MAG: Transcriptional regulator, TraR/DksA family [Parcubacteria group bacterium GW2011_GWA2_42_14]